MIEAIEKIFDLLMKLVKYRGDKRRDLYDLHITPIFDLMCKIHEDYTDIFNEVHESLLQKDADGSKLRYMILKKAASLGHIRQIVWHLAKELRIKDNCPDQVRNFANSIIFYLLNPTGIPPEEISPESTRLNALIDSLFYFAEEKYTQEQTIGQVEHQKERLIYAWEKFSSQYAKVKLYLLK